MLKTLLNIRFITATLILSVLAFAGTVFNLPLNFGVNFLFGSIFIFIGLRLYGLYCGLAVSLCQGIGMLVLWGHPYALLVGLAQTYVIGVVLDKKPSSNMPGWTLLFWSCFGIGFILLCYHYFLDLSWLIAAMAAVKQAINEIFNALIATLILHFIPANWFATTQRWRHFDVYHMQINQLVGMAFLSSLIIIQFDAQTDAWKLDNTVQTNMVNIQNGLTQQVSEWQTRHLNVLANLATQPKAITEHDLVLLQNSDTNFLVIHKVGMDGNITLSSQGDNQAVRDANYSEREWFHTLMVTKKPVISNAVIGKTTGKLIVAMAVPFFNQDVMSGFILASISTEQLVHDITAYTKWTDMLISLVDNKGKVIGSNIPSLSPTQEYSKGRGGKLVKINNALSRRVPDNAKSAIQSWKDSSYVLNEKSTLATWAVVVEQPLGSITDGYLYKLFVNFSAIFVMAIIVYLIGSRLVRVVSEPLRKLSEVTVRMQHDLARVETHSFPSSNIEEISALSNNFQQMAEQLRGSYLDLTMARDEAERANVAKSVFLSSMSHELRTPLNAILGFSQLMEIDSNLSEKHKEYIHEILKAGQHLLQLINEVLDLSKIETGKLSLSIEPVELSSILEECIHLLSPLAKFRKIAMVYHETPNVVVYADRTRLKQAILNLLSNAVKYNNEKGEVLVEVIAIDSTIYRIKISDTGPGIPAEHLNELFLPFNRLGAESSGIEGTGIGLTITKKIVDLMGGKLGVSSVINVGSQFWIDLHRGQLLKLKDIEKAHPLNNSATQDTRQYILLYVEDNPANLKLVQELISYRPQYQLLTAKTAEQGIQLAINHKPDLILLDINLPDMDGFQILRQLRSYADLANKPIIAVTANAMPNEIRKGIAAGFQKYLTKPLDVNYFYEVLDELTNPTDSSQAAAS